MRAIRRTDTKPEMVLRRALHRQGYRFRKDYRLDLSGGARVRPDIAFTARRVAVFVDGCFWHACPEHGSKPARNVWYWGPKLRRNVERDRAADAALAAAGWEVVRIWEHESLEAAIAAVVAALARSQDAAAKAERGAAAGGRTTSRARPAPAAGPGAPRQARGAGGRKARRPAPDAGRPGGPAAPGAVEPGAGTVVNNG